MMGLDMIEAMPRLRGELDLDVDVRIGVHTGPVVAGVIGTQKHAYDIWGDTVNVASRMESHGAPGRLQVSDEVRQALGLRYHVEERGMIEIKNHESRRTWFVLRLAPLGSELTTMAAPVRREPVPEGEVRYGCMAQPSRQPSLRATPRPTLT
jgi:class 3 adenylate cyclase